MNVGPKRMGCFMMLTKLHSLLFFGWSSISLVLLFPFQAKGQMLNWKLPERKHSCFVGTHWDLGISGKDSGSGFLMDTLILLG